MRLCADEYRLSLIIVFIILFFGAYFLYQVQYKTGIDLIPLFPIDDSGFEWVQTFLFNSRVISNVWSRYLFCSEDTSHFTRKFMYLNQ